MLPQDFVIPSKARNPPFAGTTAILRAASPPTCNARYSLCNFVPMLGHGNLVGYWRTIAMLPAAYRITRVQKTLRWFEEDILLLNMRVKDLSAEQQRSARQFAAAVVSQTRTELDRLLKEQVAVGYEAGEVPCEPAD
jgi:hypothetical protein